MSQQQQQQTLSDLRLASDATSTDRMNHKAATEAAIDSYVGELKSLTNYRLGKVLLRAGIHYLDHSCDTSMFQKLIHSLVDVVGGKTAENAQLIAYYGFGVKTKVKVEDKTLTVLCTKDAKMFDNFSESSREVILEQLFNGNMTEVLREFKDKQKAVKEAKAKARDAKKPAEPVIAEELEPKVEEFNEDIKELLSDFNSLAALDCVSKDDPFFITIRKDLIALRTSILSHRNELMAKANASLATSSGAIKAAANG